MTIENLIEQAQTIAPAEIPQFLGTLETARAHALMRLQAPAPSVRPEDRLIGINAAASLFKPFYIVSVSFIQPRCHLRSGLEKKFCFQHRVYSGVRAETSDEKEMTKRSIKAKQ